MLFPPLSLPTCWIQPASVALVSEHTSHGEVFLLHLLLHLLILTGVQLLLTDASKTLIDSGGSPSYMVGDVNGIQSTSLTHRHCLVV